MNITFQLELNTSNASKEGRVLIRCTQNRKHKRFSTGVAVASNFWDKVRHKVKKTHPISNDLNNLPQEKLRKVTTIYTKLLSEQDEVTHGTLARNKLINKGESKPAYCIK